MNNEKQYRTMGQRLKYNPMPAQIAMAASIITSLANTISNFIRRNAMIHMTTMITKPVSRFVKNVLRNCIIPCLEYRVQLTSKIPQLSHSPQYVPKRQITKSGWYLLQRQLPSVLLSPWRPRRMRLSY